MRMSFEAQERLRVAAVMAGYLIFAGAIVGLESLLQAWSWITP